MSTGTAAVCSESSWPASKENSTSRAPSPLRTVRDTVLSSATSTSETSRESVRAVTAALPILKAALKVTLLMIDPQKTSSTSQPGAEIAQWLSRHGVEAALQHDSADGSDIGGVILKLNDEDAIAAAFASLLDTARKAAPDARVDGVLVQAMSTGHIELVMGAQLHPVFGMIVMVGFGGVLIMVRPGVGGQFAIGWPATPTVLSPRDAAAPDYDPGHHLAA